MYGYINTIETHCCDEDIGVELLSILNVATLCSTFLHLSLSSLSTYFNILQEVRQAREDLTKKGMKFSKN